MGLAWLVILLLYPQFTAATSDDGDIPHRRRSDSTVVGETPVSSRTYSSLLLSSSSDMRSGVENVFFLHSGLSRLEDRFVGSRWFAEENAARKAAGVGARFAKYVLLDVPLDFAALLFVHEYYGHASRYRELGFHDIEYHFEFPPPYGSGEGYAHLSSLHRPLTDLEWIAMWQGGLETHDVIQRRLNLRWFARRELHYREASFYFWTWQDRFQYIQGANENLALDIPDTDPEGYIRLLNRQAGYSDPNSLLMTVEDLKRSNLVSLANPFLWTALFVQLKTYLWDGKSAARMPAIPLGAIRYLPAARMALTPFGPEYHLEHYVQAKNLVSVADVRIGDRTIQTGWWGIGLIGQNVYQNDRISLDAGIDVWKQPEMDLVGNSVNDGTKKWGSAASLRGHYDLTRGRFPFSLVAELGYKTSGFLEGYDLDASPILLVGLALRD